MSLFSWISRDKPTKATEPAAPGRAEPNRAAGTTTGARKSDRVARRELLYSVVRESMARAGVLSASYKFKVLSLDTAGRQFLVMVDLAGSERAGVDLLTDIEAVITQRAKSRHDLVVSAVYWRRSDQIGAGTRSAAGRQAARSGAAPVIPSQPAELLSEPAPLAPARAARAAPPAAAEGIDPIQEEELAALRAALANGVGGGAPASAPKAARNPSPAAASDTGPPTTGFADTVVRRDDEPRGRTLSSTQAGDLN